MPLIKPQQLAYLDTKRPLNNIMAHIDALQVAKTPQKVKPTAKQTENLANLSMLLGFLSDSGYRIFNTKNNKETTFHYTRYLWQHVDRDDLKLTEIKNFISNYGFFIDKMPELKPHDKFDNDDKHDLIEKFQYLKLQLDPEKYDFIAAYCNLLATIQATTNFDELPTSLIDDIDYLQDYYHDILNDELKAYNKIFLIHLKSDPDHIYQVMPLYYDILKSKANQVDFDIHVYPKTELPNLIYQNLNDPANDDKIRATNPILSQLQQLWMLQNQQQIKISKTIDSKFKIIDTIYNQLDFNNQKSDYYLSPSEIAQFFNEYQHQHLTQATSRVQYWLSNQDQDEYLQLITHDQNADRLANMQLVDADSDEYATINNLIASVAHRYQLAAAIKLQDTPNIDAPHHITAIHGTINSSIIPIILNGLKTSDELDHQKIDYSFTGNSLGNGVYFTDPKVDIKRSINFTDKNHSSSMTKSAEEPLNTDHAPAYHILFVADIAYHQMHIVDDYDDCDNIDADLIRAEGVGTSTTSDELVARHSNQIQLKYLIILKDQERK